MVIRLGTGTNTAAVYTRGGGTQLFPLDGVTNLEWNRTRNAFSTSLLDIRRGEGTDCWRDLGKIDPWAYELVFFRDGRRVWEGPIRDITWGTGSCHIDAVDVLGWTARRRIRAARVSAALLAVSDEAEWGIRAAFGIDDPNVLAHLLVLHHTSEAKVTRDVAANSAYYADDLNTLAGQGANYTVIGRRPVVWPDEVILGRLDTLIPERDLVAEVTVTASGDDLATAVTATNDDNQAAKATAQDPGGDVNVSGLSAYYGFHDMIHAAGSIKGTPALARVASAQVAQSYPVPLLVTVPEGSQMNCDAPFNLEDLVPGVIVPVESTATPRKVSTTMVLTATKVTQTSEEDEKVAVSLSMPSQLAGA